MRALLITASVGGGRARSIRGAADAGCGKSTGGSPTGGIPTPPIIRPVRLHRPLALVALAAALAVPAAPAAAAQRAASRPAADRLSAPEQRWLLTVDQLVANTVDSGRDGSFTGGSTARAQALIADPMTLFETVTAFAVYASCSETLAAAGSPSNRLRAIRDAVRTACRQLVPASALFGAATRDRRPAGLVKADRQAVAGVVLMRKAAARLAAFHKATA